MPYFIRMKYALPLLLLLSSCVNSIKNKECEMLRKALDCRDDVAFVCDSNMKVYSLGSLEGNEYQLVQSATSCGNNGTCGDFIGLIKNKKELVYSSCGSVDSVVMDSKRGLQKAYLTGKGYQTGPLTSLLIYYDDKFQSIPLRRNGIPLDVLRQLPLKAKEENNYFDHSHLNELVLDTLYKQPNGENLYLCTGPPNIFREYKSEYGQDYWVFKTDEQLILRQLAHVSNVDSVSLLQTDKKLIFQRFKIKEFPAKDSLILELD